MTDVTAQIIITVITVLGSGGIGAAIVTALANRKKNQAEASVALAGTARELTDISQEMVRSMNSQLKDLAKKYKSLETEVANLKLELLGRERMINELKLENSKLKIQVEELQAENQAKDVVINGLIAKVKYLEDRLDRLTSQNRGDG